MGRTAGIASELNPQLFILASFQSPFVTFWHTLTSTFCRRSRYHFVQIICRQESHQSIMALRQTAVLLH